MSDYLGQVSRSVRWLAIFVLGVAVLLFLALEVMMFAIPIAAGGFKGMGFLTWLGVTVLFGFLLFVCSLLLCRFWSGTKSANGITVLPLWVIRVFGLCFLAAAPFVFLNGWLGPFSGLHTALIGIAMLFVGRMVENARTSAELKAAQIRTEQGAVGQSDVHRIRVFDAPPGSPPEWVRRAWVGLLLPLALGESGSRQLPGYQINYGPFASVKYLWRLIVGPGLAKHYYVVPADAAIAILEEHNLEAAAWWRTTAPAAIGPGQTFGFAAEVCEEVS